jgi:hypothetical protein
MNTDTTPTACGIGRSNIIIRPEELFRFTQNPTELRVLTFGPNGYVIHRDAQNHPHVAPAMQDDNGTRYVLNIDGVRFDATTVTEAHVGDKVAFDHKGDVWTIGLDRNGFIIFEAC